MAVFTGNLLLHTKGQAGLLAASELTIPVERVTVLYDPLTMDLEVGTLTVDIADVTLTAEITRDRLIGADAEASATATLLDDYLEADA